MALYAFYSSNFDIVVDDDKNRPNSGNHDAEKFIYFCLFMFFQT